MELAEDHVVIASAFVRLATSNHLRDLKRWASMDEVAGNLNLLWLMSCMSLTYLKKSGV